MKLDDRESMTQAATAGPRHIFAGRLRPLSRLGIATVCGLAFGLVCTLFAFALVRHDGGQDCEYIVYWATSQQVVHHANPYDQGALFQLEQSKGLPTRRVYYMRNPPWALPLLYPFGLLEFRVGSALWTLLLLISLLASVRIAWKMYGASENHRQLLGYTFAPALIALLYRQTSLFALLGWVLFLRLHRSHPFIAGLALWLCTLKPHLFVPVAMVLLVWVVVNRKFAIFAGAGFALGLSCVIAAMLDPSAWTQYAAMVRTSGMNVEFIPCFSSVLRYSAHSHPMWVEFVPCIIATLWGLAYFWKRRSVWEWTEHGSMLSLVSILAAPYCWLYDQVLAIPALLQAACRSTSRDLLLMLAFLSAVIEMALVGSAWLHSDVFRLTYWSTPAWILWYWRATSNLKSPVGRFPSMALSRASSPIR